MSTFNSCDHNKLHDCVKVIVLELTSWPMSGSLWEHTIDTNAWATRQPSVVALLAKALLLLDLWEMTRMACLTPLD